MKIKSFVTFDWHMALLPHYSQILNLKPADMKRILNGQIDILEKLHFSAMIKRNNNEFI